MASSLHHEHLVRINDPANIAGQWLSREELWAGLRHTVESPQTLDESIDAVAVEQIEPGLLARTIRRGDLSLCDTVRLVPNEWLEITADTSGMFAGSTLTIRIEEPAPGMLFVRFTYLVCGLADAREIEEDTARCSAYKSSDINRIREARRHIVQRGSRCH